jgi:hypothetical protein
MCHCLGSYRNAVRALLDGSARDRGVVLGTLPKTMYP